MQDICCKLSRTAAVVVIFLAACVGSAWAQYPWQFKDIIVCYSGGKCNAERLVGGTTPTFLNSVSAGSGDVRGAALNNSLHLLVTNGGSGTSNVVQFSIATINPFSGAPVPQSATSFPSSGGTDSNNAQAVAVNSAGHMFVGNSGSSGTPQASIVELDAHGVRVTPTATSIFTFPTSSDPCATTSLSSLDLSAVGDAIYVTSGDGKIRKVGPLSSGLSSASCTVFADFGPGVSLFGIRDIPAGALANNCPSATCSSENILVVATGLVDLDTGETGESGETTPDGVNVCTNTTGATNETCALLLSTATSTPALNGAVWKAGNVYGTAAVNTTSILDAYLHVETVVTPGKSGSDEPLWSQNGGTVLDNAVVWKNLGGWIPTHSYTVGQLAGEAQPSMHLHKVKTPGKSGAGPTTPSGGWIDGNTTFDNAVIWSDQGAWTALITYPTNEGRDKVGDSAQHLWQVQIAGASGPVMPPFANHDGVGHTLIEGLVWADTGLNGLNNCPTAGSCNPWLPGKAYCFTAQCPAGPYISDSNGEIWVVTAPQLDVTAGGISNQQPPPFEQASSQYLPDNPVTWIDQGQSAWQHDTAYPLHNTQAPLNSFVIDTNNPPHVQQVATGGTSGPVTNPPPFASTDSGVQDGIAANYPNPGQTTDGLTWSDEGSAAWGPITDYHATSELTTYVVDPTGNVQQVTTTGTSGSAAIDSNPATPYLGWTETTGGSTTDGLQWQESTSPAIVRRYRIFSQNFQTLQTGLQAVALDPLVTDCTNTNANNNCQNTFTPNRTVANFWLADTGSGNVFKVAFSDGSFTPYDTQHAASCPGGDCGAGIHSIVIYGGESAAQPGVASLLLGGSLQSSNNFTARQTILGNTITSTLYGAPSASVTPISLYASLVPTSSCFNDSNVGSLPCRATVASDTTKSLVWKIDIPQGQASALPLTQALNTALVGPLANPPVTPPSFGIDNGTDVFVDMGYDDTTFVGSDPGTRTVSVHSLHEITPQVPPGTSQCTFSSPLPNTCYKLNRTTLNFTFSCPGLPPSQVKTLNPVLSLVKKPNGQAPQFINVSGANATNGKPAFRYNATSNFWTYQLNLNGFASGTYLGTAFDLSNQVQSFTTQNFRLDTTCK